MSACNMYGIYIIVTTKFILHINIYYIQFYVTFQHFHDSTDCLGGGGSGPHMGQGHPSWELVFGVYS